MKAATFFVIAPLVAVFAQSDIPSLLGPIEAPPPSTTSGSALGSLNPGPTGFFSDLLSEAESALSAGVTPAANPVVDPAGNQASSNFITLPSGSLLEPLLSAPIPLPTPNSIATQGDGASSSDLTSIFLPSLSLLAHLLGLPSCTPDACYSALSAAGPSATSFCSSYLATASPAAIQKRDGVTTLLKKRACSPKSLASANVAIIPQTQLADPATPSDVCTASAQVSSVCGCLGVRYQMAGTPQTMDPGFYSEISAALTMVPSALSAA